MTFDPDNPADEAEAEAVEMARDTAFLIEGAIFKTMTAAIFVSDRQSYSSREVREARNESQAAWRDIADKLVEFAVSDD